MSLAHVKAAAVLLTAPLATTAPRLALPTQGPAGYSLPAPALPSPSFVLPAPAALASPPAAANAAVPAKVDVAAVRALAREALAQADEHGRVTPELQERLTAAEAEVGGRLTVRARRAWQSLVARLGAKTGLPFVTPEDSTPLWLRGGNPLAGFRSSERLPERADVVIVGAGLTGSAAAYALVSDARARGLRVVVLDSGDPSEQASGRNGGNFHLMPENYLGGYRGLVAERVKRVRLTRPGLTRSEARAEGERQARAIVGLALVNRGFLTSAVAAEGLDADLAPNGSLRVPLSRAEERGLTDDARLLRELGAPARMLSPAETDAALSLPEGTSRFGSRLSDYDGNYQPFKYATGLLQAALRRGAELYTRVAVSRVEEADGGHLVHTAQGVIAAKHVVSAVNAFTASLLPELGAVKAYRSQVQVTEHAADVWHGRTVTAERGDFYGHFTAQGAYRDAEGRRRGPLLLGGGADRPMKDPRRLIRSHWVLKKVLRQRDAYVPEAAGVPPSAAWSGPMGFTEDRLPLIGWLRKGLFVAAAYNGYGGAYTQAAALAAAEAILSGRLPAWLPEDVFSPRRFLTPR